MKKNKAFKKVTGRLHLWLGLVSGFILLVVALTGSLLVFEEELEYILFKQRHIVSPQEIRLSADSLIQISNSIFKNQKVTRLIIEQDPTHSVEARIGKKGKQLKVAYLNPYTGKVLYKGKYNEQFFRQVRSLHRYLLLENIGKIITGISCCICLFLVCSGLILWWPSSKKAVKQRLKIKWNASAKRLIWDLHAASGFYISLILCIICLTGLVWSYDCIDQLIFKLADGKLPQETKIKNFSTSQNVTTGIFAKMEQSIDSLYPYTGSLSFTIPAEPNMTIKVQKTPSTSVSRQVDIAYFDSKTGFLVEQKSYASFSAGAKIRRMVLPLHTGSLWGWPTKLVAFIVSIFTASLPVTGVLIWWNRKVKKKSKPKKKN